ncbi:hypothetical protein ND748_15560 [Frankia sp. AiPs1]|nr:hypothetical protein [Frankia sp. AiPs1]
MTTLAEFHRVETDNEQIDNGAEIRARGQDGPRQVERFYDRSTRTATAGGPPDAEWMADREPPPKGTENQADRTFEKERRWRGESSGAETADDRPFLRSTQQDDSPGRYARRCRITGGLLAAARPPSDSSLAMSHGRSRRSQ